MHCLETLRAKNDEAELRELGAKKELLHRRVMEVYDRKDARLNARVRRDFPGSVDASGGELLDRTLKRLMGVK